MRRVALITGAASGIGKAIAEAFAREAYDVFTVDLHDADFEGDLTGRDANAAAVAGAVERFGRLDVVIANAGVQHVAPIADFPEDEWDRIVALLLTSPFLLAKHAWPHLQASGDARFMVVASAHALAASPFKSAYVAAKHGALGLVRTLAMEGAEHGIATSAICPGYVRTPLVEKQIAAQAEAHGVAAEQVLEEIILAPHAVKELIEPEQVADLALYLAGPDRRFMTGAPVIIDGGWTAR